MTAWIRLLAAGVVILVGHVVVCGSAAQTSNGPAPHATDSIVISGQIDPGSIGNGGNGMSLDWIRRTTGGRIFTAGGGSYSIADSRWFLGRIGGAISPVSTVTLAAQATLGGGATAGRGFGHRAMRGDVTFKAAPRVSLTMADEYLNVSDAHGHLVRLDAGLLVSRTSSLNVTYAVSAGGNLNTTFTVVRLAVPMRTVSLIGGGAYGRTVPEVVALPGVPHAGTQYLKQGFFGISVPMSRADLRVAIDVLNLPAVTRRTLMVSVVVPLGR